MSISPVGSYPALFAPSAPAGGAVPVPSNGVPGYSPDAYAGTPAPTYGATAAPASTGLNFGRLASWAAGALGAAKFILPHLNGGWLKLVAVLGGAVIGNMGWSWLERDVRPDKAGSVGHVATIGGGLLGGLMLGRSILGSNPAGFLLGGVVAIGGFLGHKLYAMMNR